ncbi:sulfite exporter TauE/SafE family protein [Kordiimonas lipolytica]|uniref:Probable membrane transporter protein n=1 Tax=Kordiimonas lipolytica TaxID=1662421 RepID=A0ABV8UA35_9PROT|nr:sulfite exporter TauE/SafE family protein [Kordiimonas lipolytica]
MELILTHLLPLIGAGLVAGFLAGLLGIGGGIVTIPVLVLVYRQIGMPEEWLMHIAIASSLTAIIATNTSSVLAHHRKNGVDWSIVKGWWFVVAAGAVLGSFFAKGLKTEELVYFFATLASLVAIKMMLPFDRWKLGQALPEGGRRYLAPGLIGFFSAVMGIGGGSFSVPYMTLYSVPIHRAVGTASLIGLVISVSAGLGYLVGGWNVAGLPSGMAGFIHLPSAFTVAVAAVLMAPVGAKVAHMMPKTALSIAFGIFLVVATIKLVSGI